MGRVTTGEGDVGDTVVPLEGRSGWASGEAGSCRLALWGEGWRVGKGAGDVGGDVDRWKAGSGEIWDKVGGC